jgi:hypothetical protein
LQLEAVIYACQQHGNHLASGERVGYLIGEHLRTHTMLMFNAQAMVPASEKDVQLRQSFMKTGYAVVAVHCGLVLALISNTTPSVISRILVQRIFKCMRSTRYGTIVRNIISRRLTNSSHIRESTARIMEMSSVE